MNGRTASLILGFVGLAVLAYPTAGPFTQEPFLGSDPALEDFPRIEPGDGPVPPTRSFEVPGVFATLADMIRFAESAGEPAPVPQADTSGVGPILISGSTMDEFAAVLGPQAFIDPSLAPPVPLQTFPGPGFGFAWPPDTQGAAGPEHLVSVVNGGTGFAVFDKDTGALLFGPISLFAFWGPLNAGGPPFYFPFDPRILYDQYSSRWVVMSDANGHSADSHVLFAISKDSNPLLGFHQFAFKADLGGTNWADFPGLGVDPGSVYVTNNILQNSNDLFLGAQILVVNKDSMLSGGPAVVDVFGATGYTWKPAHAFGPTAVNYVLSEAFTAGGTSKLLRILRFSFPAGRPVADDLGFVRVSDYRFTTILGVPQKGCSFPLETGRFEVLLYTLENAVLRNGKIYATNDVDGPPAEGASGKSEVAWYEIDPARARFSAPFQGPLRQGRVRDPELDFYYPSIAVNADEVIALGFNGSSRDRFASAFYTLIHPDDPPGLLPPVGLLKEGIAPYFRSGGRNRWGDYSGTAVDPDDDRTFWTIQEYAETEFPPGCPTDFTGKWGTWWGSFRPCRSNADCVDDRACNGTEFCDVASGRCRAGEAVPCPGDGNPCTRDACDEESDSCYPPIPDEETPAGPDGICRTADDQGSLYGPDGTCGTGDDGAGDGLCSAIDNCPLVINPAQADSDGDGFGDACDNCPATPNPPQSDADADGPGDACDNCPAEVNPLQEEGDGDGVGDRCDVCPTVPDPLQVESDGDGVGNACDNCPLAANPLQQDADADAHGDACDNCANVLNFGQEDREGDGAGDACQPFVAIGGFRQDGGAVVLGEAVLLDPQGQTLSGSVSVRMPGTELLVPNAFPTFACSQAASLPLGAGVRIFYLGLSGRGFLSDAGQAGCSSGSSVRFAFGRCGDPGIGFVFPSIEITGRPAPFDLCVRAGQGGETQDLSVNRFDSASLSLGTFRFAGGSFAESVLPEVDLAGLLAGQSADVALEATDGETKPARARAAFVSQGESLLVFDLDAPPAASAGPDRVVECSPPEGSTIVLDGSGSVDPDAMGPAGGITLYEWFEDLGRPGQRFLGSGVILPAFLEPGTHAVTLRVTDGLGATGTDEARITVTMAATPEMQVHLSPSTLWPPNHRIVPVTATMTTDGFCSPPAFVVESVASDEPDDAEGAGDGTTIGDVEGVFPGAAVLAFGLRAERAGAGAGRTYTVVYRGTDDQGNSASAGGSVFVPHDEGGVTEPVMIRLSESGAGTIVRWDEVPGAAAFNVVRGELGRIRDQDEKYHLGPLRCIAAGISGTDTAGFEDPEMPALGGAFFYLVEYLDGLWSEYGTVSAAKERFTLPGQSSCD